MWLDDDEADMARFFNALFDLLEYMIHELLLEDIINESFQNHTVERKPTTSNAIESLKCYECKTDEVTCCVCQLDVNEGDKIIELPCGHKFHGEDCECPGIIPWLKDNNTCPLCKHELPFSETGNDINEDDNNNVNPMLEEEIQTIVNNVIVNIINGEVPDIRNISLTNLELVNRIRTSINN